MAKAPDPIVLALARRRIELGLTLRQVGERIGAAHSLICRWESGQKRPQLDTARRWADVLDLEIGLREVRR